MADGDEGTAQEVTLGGLVAGSLLTWVFTLGVPVVATRLKGRGLVADLGLRFRWRDLWWFPAGVALQGVAVPLLYWPLLRLLDRTTDDVSADAREVVESASGAGIVVLVLVLCVGAPIVEELFYRGLLLRSLERRWTTTVAVVASTVVFGIAHLQGIQLPALLLFGAAAALLAARFDRLGPSILCHSGFNACTVFVLLVLDR